MPTPRKYANPAARQAAYRQRQVARYAASPKTTPPDPPGHARWRRLVRSAYDTLRTLQQEMEHYAASRSETWQASDQGEAFDERLTTLGEALELLTELAPTRTAAHRGAAAKKG